MTDNTAILVVLFDLGGILAKLRDPAETFGLSVTREQFNASWLGCQAVRDYERGAIDTDTFARRAVSELGFDMDTTEFMARFDHWLHSLYPGALELIREIPDRYRTGVLSNINALHWGRPGVGPDVEQVVDKVFLSFETGKVKPDNESFRQVTDHFECCASEVLFIDDNPINTIAAADCGFNSRQCHGIAEVRDALVAAGIL